CVRSGARDPWQMTGAAADCVERSPGRARDAVLGIFEALADRDEDSVGQIHDPELSTEVHDVNEGTGENAARADRKEGSQSDGRFECAFHCLFSLGANLRRSQTRNWDQVLVRSMENRIEIFAFIDRSFRVAFGVQSQIAAKRRKMSFGRGESAVRVSLERGSFLE